MPNSFTHRDVRQLIADAPALPRNQSRTEVRMMAALITGGFITGVVKSADYMLTATSSMLAYIGDYSTVPEQCLAAVFMLAAVFTVPHLFILIFWPDMLRCKLPRKSAAVSAYACAVMWFYLAALAFELHLPRVPWWYLWNMVGCTMVAMTYSFSVNAQQLRERLEDANETK